MTDNLITNDSVRNVNESYYDTSNVTLENEKSSNDLVYEAMKIIALQQLNKSMQYTERY